MSEFSSNGVSIYYEVTGEGIPLVLAHTYAGDYRSWEPQVRFFLSKVPGDHLQCSGISPFPGAH